MYLQRVGGDKEKKPGKISIIRAVIEDDLESIIEIDKLVLGERRPEYWEERLRY
jgi:hypothetical protein